ncbi:MAG: stage 0 sporulation family protein [Lachnospiraceae bacterium]|nr:stage 0 sporulation family protein [Lachnospiraceae bacterium]
MIQVIGVSFRNAGKVYYFTPGNLPVKRGLHVIVETARGTEYGTVVGELKEIDEESIGSPIKPILRIATKRDDEQEQANREKEKKALKICKEKIAEHKLDMKLIDVEYTFDNNKVLFYFTADGRVDFRDLVKDLAGVFRTRIELRQIGVRDETKLMGGIGICGRPLCCHVYLSDFAPVSIKMAKEQSLSLNPTKISGVCGRLMCCLKNEEDTYEYLNKLMPGVGDTVKEKDGTLEGEVHSVNVLRQTVKVLVDDEDGDREIHEYKVEDLTFEPRKGGNKNNRRKDKKKNKAEIAEEIAEEKELEKLVEADEEDQTREKQEEGGDNQKGKKGRGDHKGGRRNGGERDNRNNDRGERNNDNNRNRSGNRNRKGHNNNNRGNQQGKGPKKDHDTDNGKRES